MFLTFFAKQILNKRLNICKNKYLQDSSLPQWMYERKHIAMQQLFSYVSSFFSQFSLESLWDFIAIKIMLIENLELIQQAKIAAS